MLIHSLLLCVAAQATEAIPGTATETRTLVVGHHERLVFERDVRRVFVANPDVLYSEVLDSREILISALQPGFTSLLVWFAEGEPLETQLTVRRDLSLLTELVREIDPAIQVELAPDRDFVILRGVVPSVAIRDAAEAAASSYLGAGWGVPVLAENDEGEVTAPQGELMARRSRRGGVLNLLRVSDLPAILEERISEAIAPMADGSVTVRRIQVGNFPDDEKDVFLLEGTVPDQVTLTRLLFVASRTVRGGTVNGGVGQRGDVRVLADEAGALTFGLGGGQGGQGRQGGGQGGGLGLGGGSFGGATSGQRSGQQLFNRINTQVGRAKIVEAAQGRVLSTIQVSHLPLVQVDVRLYEVNRTKIRTWRNQLDVAASDFDQPQLLPAPESTALQGANAQGVGDGDLQGLLGFLNGTLSGRGQAVSGGFAIDNVFQILVEEELARSLSSPSLTVLSGELAQFQVGGQIPVPLAVTVGGGTDQILNSVEFRDFGINLSVRPLVEERRSSRITLDVIPQIILPDLALTAAIGSATGQATSATAFESRATRTSARVFDGDALVIGGLTTQRNTSGQSQVPIIGSVPVLGWLFRNEAADDEETELVIVVTPRVVREPRPEAQLWAFPSADEVLARCLAAVSSQNIPENPDADPEPPAEAGH
ncbi:MAG: pilus assembly protein N-terminal domain-containing protein [Planctomycetota bacterium]|nr:pilus assembly protein N-terminal domain-containing protein [Planctomycetota bacterium]